MKVLTADRREYSRKLPGFPDMSVPPPNSFDDFPPEYGFPGEPEPFYGRYEPTQDSQWGKFDFFTLFLPKKIRNKMQKTTEQFE